MKHTVILTTPRTGSTLTFMVVARYLEAKQGAHRYRRELFNEFHYNLWHIERDGQHFNLPQYEPGAYKSVPVLEQGKLNVMRSPTDQIVPIDVENAARLALLQQTTVPHVLHVHAAPLDQQVFAYLREHAEFVCVERMDKLAQILSYGVAMHTKVFHAFSIEKYPKPAPRSITLTRQIFDQQVNRILEYQKRKEQLGPFYWQVEYETIECLPSPWDILSHLGWDDWPTYINPEDEKLPVKVGTEDREELFANLDEIRGWAKEAGL